MLVGFDLTNKKSFEEVNYWIEQIETNKRKDYPIGIVLVGNKCDLKENIVIKEDDIELIKKKYSIEYFSTSAKDGTNVRNAFEYLIKTIIKNKGLLEKLGLYSDFSIDDIVIKEKENQGIVVKIAKKRKEKNKPC